MKILRLQAENIKRLTVVEITPDGNLVQITGKNGQGKSSVLDAIWWALTGTDHIQASPIRKGANKAHIRLDLGELIVTRTFNRKEEAPDLLEPAKGKSYTTSIKVEAPSGARFPSPQTMIDKLLGAISFEPLIFANAKPEVQFEMVRALVPGFDFKAMERENAGDYLKRTELNRLAKSLRARIEAVHLPPDLPAERTDESALVADLEAAGQVAASIERAKAARAKIESALAGSNSEANHSRAMAAGIENKIAELRREIEAQLARASRFDVQSAACLKELGDLPPDPTPPDTTEIRAAIGKARLVNRWIEERDTRAKYEKEAAEIEASAEALSKAIDAREAAGRAAIASASLALPNMSFAGDQVLMNGVPFEQASTAERTAASMAVAMASNPTLRVIRITNGNDLDENTVHTIAELAEEHDCQVWIERIGAVAGPQAVLLEDGHVKAGAHSDV